MENIKILIASHRMFTVPKSQIYFPIQVGSDLTDEKYPGFIQDNQGENISNLNPYFSELTALYWAWKNLESDYVGLVHYRRYFAKSKQKYNSSKSLDTQIINISDLSRYLNRNTVIVPQKRKYYIETLYSHYSNTFDGFHLDETRRIICEINPEYQDDFDKIMKQTHGYMFNMLIAPKPLLDAYCEWLFPILFELYARIDVSQMSAFEQRLFGRVSELLFNVWILHNNVEIQELPLLDAYNVNWFKKGSAFLMAKFLKKRYTDSF